MKANIAKIRNGLAGIYPKEEIDAMVRIIFEQLMSYSTVDMVLRADSEVPEFIAAKIDDVVARLQRHEPLQYILDDAYFYGMHFHVTPATLIPRPETEQLIDLIVGENDNRSDLAVLDIGTGSGCIAIALARSLRFPTVSAIDISPDAIAVAERNARELKAKIGFTVADILTAVPPKEQYHIVVSNPPYIALSESKAMDSNVLDYEPHSALFVPDADPLLFYRAITHYTLSALKPGGRLYFEINTRFADDTARLLADAGMEQVELHRDYTQRLRFASATKPLG
ncbi:MAG: peptide chain release factor N(5)-glutamine methyltransferase [Muribaculaceae bacterium]